MRINIEGVAGRTVVIRTDGKVQGGEDKELDELVKWIHDATAAPSTPPPDVAAERRPPKKKRDGKERKAAVKAA